MGLGGRVGVIYVEGMDSKVMINDSESETAREKLLQAHHPGQPRTYVVKGVLPMCSAFVNRKLVQRSQSNTLEVLSHLAFRKI